MSNQIRSLKGKIIIMSLSGLAGILLLWSLVVDLQDKSNLILVVLDGAGVILATSIFIKGLKAKIIEDSK